MDESQTTLAPAQSQETLAGQESAPAGPTSEKKPEGLEHDPYEWGKCAITAHIVWLPDGSVLLGVRNHLDAPIIALLTGDALATLPGHTAELSIPKVETIADLLAQLREELPLRAQAEAERNEAARQKAATAKSKPASGKKNNPPASAKTTAPAATPPVFPAKLPPLEKTPTATQVSLFNFMTGGN